MTKLKENFIYVLLMALIFIFVTVACSKASIIPIKQPPVTLNIIHAMPNGHAIVSLVGDEMQDKFFLYAMNFYLYFNYGSAASYPYSTKGGANEVRIVPITDTNFYIFKGTLNLEPNGVYSLFLAGDTLHADTLLVKDIIPSYTDSFAGLRFVNVATGGKSLSITPAGDPAHPLINLGYRRASEFFKYQARTVPGLYKFDVRDAATGDSLTSFTWYYTSYKNNTVVISGSTDPATTTPLFVFSYKQYSNF